MNDPAYVKIFDRLRRVGHNGDPALRYAVAVKMLRVNPSKEDLAYEQLDDTQFYIAALPIIDSVQAEMTRLEKLYDM